MAKVLIIYDSVTGHTEAMAKAVAEGARTVKKVNVDLKKIGTPFPLTILDAADAIIIGSPSRYSHETEVVRYFLKAVADYNKAGRLKLEGKIGAVFGSYGWDGGWNIEMLENNLTELGMKIGGSTVLAVNAPTEKVLDACRQLGKTIADKIAK
ncbi:MAG: flavodoxin [Thermoproteota archaeon]|nr:flavodoxin [Thermoproteota archaeon]